MKDSDIHKSCWEWGFVSFCFVLLWKIGKMPKTSTILKKNDIGLGGSDVVFCLLPLLLMALDCQAGVYNFQAATQGWGKLVRAMLKMRKLSLPVEHLNFLHCLYFWDRWLNIIAPNITMTGREWDNVRERRSLFLLLLALYHWLWKSHLHNGGGRYCVSLSISWHLP